LAASEAVCQPTRGFDAIDVSTCSAAGSMTGCNKAADSDGDLGDTAPELCRGELSTRELSSWDSEPSMVELSKVEAVGDVVMERSSVGEEVQERSSAGGVWGRLLGPGMACDLGENMGLRFSVGDPTSTVSDNPVSLPLATGVVTARPMMMSPGPA